MEQHNVVRPGDFGANDGKQYFERKKAERDSYFLGTSQKHKDDIRRDVVETITKLEQGVKPAKPQRMEDT